MIKKALMFIVILVFGVSLLGCEKSDKIKITVGMWPQPFQTDDVNMFKTWKQLFETDYPQYEIVGQPYVYSPDTFFPMAESGQTPTVFQTWFTEPEKLIKNGFVKDITQNLHDLGWYDKMDPTMRDALTYEDKVYGVPQNGYGMGLFLNLNVLADVGLVTDLDGDGVYDIHDENGNPLYPTTMAELRNWATTVTQREQEWYGNDVSGLVILSSNNNGGWQFSNLAWNFGATLQYQDNSGNWIANLNSPEVVETLQWIKDLRWEDDTLPANATLSYSDWYRLIGTDSAAMAFAGSDAVSMPITNYDMDKDAVAFVPMPAGPDGDQYALFGGTPFMFSASATAEQIKGALRFLEYMGRSPEVNDITRQSIEVGLQTATAKGMPVLPEIAPWINEDYLQMKSSIERRYVNVNMNHFQDFYDTFRDMAHLEVPHYPQDMYSILDSQIQQVLTNVNSDPAALLESANNTFQTQYLNKIDE